MKNTILSDFVELFYPRTCITCHEALVKGEEQICVKCLLNIPKTNFHLYPDNKLEMRCWGRFRFNRISSFFHFEKGSDFQHLLHELKYHDNREIGRIIGKFAGYDLMESPDFKNSDLIVPVPLHPNKLKKRGYNQSEEIAYGLSEAMNIPVDSTHLLRKEENSTQTKKGFYERFENTFGIFDIKNPEDWKNKTILLIDDVITTGSTIEACAAVMENIEGLVLNIFTLAEA